MRKTGDLEPDTLPALSYCGDGHLNLEKQRWARRLVVTWSWRNNVGFSYNYHGHSRFENGERDRVWWWGFTLRFSLLALPGRNDIHALACPEILVTRARARSSPEKTNTSHSAQVCFCVTYLCSNAISMHIWTLTNLLCTCLYCKFISLTTRGHIYCSEVSFMALVT